MNKINMKYLISILFLIIVSCSGNCDSISKKFNSYDEAISLVRSTNFSVEEKVNTDSSWIDSIEYYSCDEVSGYLILNTKKGGSYIHENVPIEVWNEFKNADSFGRFYNKNIKGNYYLNIN
jgi:hypothetical protein